MSVDTVLSRLALLETHIPYGTGYCNARDNAPRVIDEADMPLFINFPGPATYSESSRGEDFYEETRQYNLRLYAKNFATGIEGEAEAMLRELIPATVVFFTARPSLGDLNLGIASLSGLAGRGATLRDDTGLTRFAFDDPQKPILGVEFHLMVVEDVQITFAPGQ